MRAFVDMASNPDRFERGVQRALDGIAISIGEQPRGGSVFP